MNNTPLSVWTEYEKGRKYNESLGLYDTVKQNEDFYIGNQWEGLSTPDLDKPVMNILQRVVSYQISQVVSDDIAANFTGADETLCDILSEEVDRVFEQNHIKSLNREALRDCAVTGDTAMYIYTDTPEFERPDGLEALGGLNIPETRLKAELLQNTNVIFGNPYDRLVQRQPYIIIAQFLCEGDVKRLAGGKGAILPDGEAGAYDTPDGDDRRVTLLTRFWKDKDSIKFYKCTRDVEVQGETDAEQRLYPIAWMSWNKRKNSYHGQAAITGMIPNQVFVNKLLAMMMHSIQLNAFPKIFYDRTKLNQWDNRIGAAIGVAGNPAEVAAAAFKAPDMSDQVFAVIDMVIKHTRENMGASDAALGNVKPDNTSAIIAVQKATSAPLELQRLDYYQFIEDYVRIALDLMRAKYGTVTRNVKVKDEFGQETETSVPIDFSGVDADELNIKIDVGEAAYWSELGQLTTMDNLFDRGLVSPEVYVEGMPGNYIRNKNKILEELRMREMAPELSDPTGRDLDPSAIRKANRYIGDLEVI